MKWSSQVEVPCSGDTCSNEKQKGMILIVRHPGTGLVNTFFSDDVINVSDAASEDKFSNLLENEAFRVEQIDFCVDPDPGVGGIIRRDVRISKEARNTSGVEIVADNDEGNVCIGK